MCGPGWNRSKIEIESARHVRRHCHVAARCTHHQHLSAGKGAAHVKQLDRLAQRAQRIAAGEAGLSAECLEHRVLAREGARVAVRRARRRGGAPGLDHRDGLARSARDVRGSRESVCVLDPFEVQAEGRDARIRAENLDEVLDRQSGLIADRKKIADRHRTRVEAQGERDRAALADEGHAALDVSADHLVGQQCRSIEEIHEAVAVGAEEGQRPGIVEQRLGQLPSGFGSELGETRAETHEATGAARGELAGHGGRIVVRHRKESGIGRARQLRDGSIVRGGGVRRAARMHAPNRPAIAHRRVARRHGVGPYAGADQGDGARRDQSLNVELGHRTHRRFNSIFREPGPHAASAAGVSFRPVSSRSTSGGKAALAGFTP